MFLQKGRSVLSQACGISRDLPVSSWDSYTVGWSGVWIINGVSVQTFTRAFPTCARTMFTALHQRCRLAISSYWSHAL